MNKNWLLLFVLVLFLCSCYPLGSFQGPDVLPEGDETVGIGLLWLTNVFSNLDTTETTKNDFLSETSVSFRRGLPHHTEIGLKVVGLPWNGGSLKGDIKWQVIRKPLLVSLDLGVSNWGMNSDTRFVGVHPKILLGSQKTFMALQLNHLASAQMTYQTEDLILGRHFLLKESNYTLTPVFGIHRNNEFPEDIYFSAGMGFSGPLDEWSKF